MRYYVYTYYINDVPEYVGKGCKDRWMHHFVRPKRNHWTNHLLKSITLERPIRVELLVFSCERAAKDKEIEIIQTIGRRDLGTGTLYNQTDGGDGGTNLSEEARQKISKALRGRPRPQCSHKYSEKSRLQMSVAQKARFEKPEERARVSQTMSRWNREQWAKRTTEESSAIANKGWATRRARKEQQRLLEAAQHTGL